MIDGKKVAITLSARYYKESSEILIFEGKGKRQRRHTSRECLCLLGFSEKFIIPVSVIQAYQQFGDSAVVPMINEVAKNMLPCILQVERRLYGS